MIIDPKINTKYRLEFTYYEFVLKILDQTLLSYTRKNNFAYSSRIKSIESICEKIETGRFSTWKDIDDKIACSIIIPNLSYSNEVIKYLENVFEVVKIRKATDTLKDPSTFRFGAVIIIGKLKAIGKDEKLPIYSQFFEIQVKSAFEHAWSVTTHDLTYKSSQIDWKLLRLAATLKSNVEQLDMIVLTAKEASKNIPEHKWPEITIKKDILHFFNNLFDRQLIPEELKPKDFNRVINNIYNIIKSKLDIWKPRKWKRDLKRILDVLEKEITILSSPSFPISLSLYQITLGILLTQEIVVVDDLKKNVLFLPDFFMKLFPNVQIKQINEFKL